MFPATAASRPSARSIAPSSSLVVDFPFVPVTATKRVPMGASNRQPSSISDQTGMPARASRCDERPLARDPRRLDEQPRAVQQAEVFLVAERAVDQRHLVPPRLEPRGRRLPGAREPVDEHLHQGRMFG